MFKIFTRVFIIILVVLVSVKITNAFNINGLSINKGFGGKITQAKATEIQNAESSGFTCTVPGSSITIKPVGNYPTTYVIPYSVISSTSTTPRSGQWILGLYNTAKTTIICTKPCPPPPGNECIKTVSLNTIKLFGTSK